ncbi:hypothetical protein NW762_010532 [Fusarium torreyae]|uniref:Uncharacterized protein n=1 Tax=Fusarium torreyae TaxID=1237075 RepID=A0A9W8VBG6_9HYPO|nr:hypothetical protein NW762_010532 [Fusarium torreyae]
MEELLKSHHRQWNSHVQQEVFQMIEKRLHRRQRGYPGEDKVVTPGRICGLHWAVIFSLKPFIKTLYDHEKEYPVEDGISLTPLGLAAAHGEIEMAEELPKAGISPDGKDYKGNLKRPPLYDTLLFGQKEVVLKLLEIGASLTLQRTDNDQSPLDLVYSTGLEGFVPLIVEEISTRPLISHHEYLFLIKGALGEALRTAVQNGLDVNEACGNGKNALDYALNSETEILLPS